MGKSKTNLAEWCKSNSREDLLQEWDYEANYPLTPKEVAPKTNRKVNWIGSKCGHKWSASIAGRTRGYGCHVCNHYCTQEGVNDLATANPELVEEWDYEKNYPLTPQNVPRGTIKKVGWICKTCQKKWDATVCSRTHGNGCPHCFKQFKVSFNEKAIEYYLSKITPVIPNYRPAFLNRKELDIFIPRLSIAIEYDGKNWHRNYVERDIEKNKLCKANSIYLIRIRESGLPDIPDSENYVVDFRDLVSLNTTIGIIVQKIAKQLDEPVNFTIDLKRDNIEITSLKRSVLTENTLDKQFPSVCAEWDYERNYPLTPNMFQPATHESVYWICSQCGNKWKQRICNRTNGHGCSKCGIIKCATSRKQNLLANGNSFAEKYPDLLKEWDYERNGDLDPYQFTIGSDNTVHWKCSKCGGRWKTSINHRTGGTGCPYCGTITKKIMPGVNDLATLFPDIAAEWDYEKNYPNKPENYAPFTHTKVGWICKICGNRWDANISNRCRGRGCNKCRWTKMAVSHRKTTLKNGNTLAEKCPQLLHKFP